MGKALTKAEVVENIYEQSSISRNDCKKIVESVINLMARAIAKDRAMLLSGFGKFECYAKTPRKGRNPQTSDTLTLDARNVIVFRLSRKFREELNRKTGS